MKRIWEEGWYRVKTEMGTTVGYYRQLQFVNLDRHVAGGAVVDKVLILSEDELQKLLVDRLPEYYEYLLTGEFNV